MKVWGDIPKVSEIYGKKQNVSKVHKTTGVPSQRDDLSISSQAKDFQTVINALKKVPDVRTEKVKDIEEKVNSGNYQVANKEVADKMIQVMTNKNI